MDHVLAFTLAAFVVVVIPGPSVLFAVSRAIAYGRTAALLTVLGGAIGSFVLAAAVAAGLGAVLQTSALLFTAVKLVGAAYLVHLGIKAFRKRRELRSAFEAGAGNPVSGRRTVVEGFVVAVTNPKSGVFFAAVLPQFVDPVGNVAGQMLVFGAIFAVLALVMDSAWGVLAGAARSWFGRSSRRLDMMGGAAGLTMVGLGVGLAVTGRKD
ncbi:LysE family translocator [Allokutzneria sp. NRRL B-24872]|uniref:LysE family translocator n=1 Tax=Allokutzneria sp. NRRL B-24872 TaxID=1137961 RepID=UPI000A38CA86|nr:LysE family translocator [Allokutzneria sp. NRRL B-24872]